MQNIREIAHENTCEAICKIAHDVVNGVAKEAIRGIMRKQFMKPPKLPMSVLISSDPYFGTPNTRLHVVVPSGAIISKPRYCTVAIKVEDNTIMFEGFNFYPTGQFNKSEKIEKIDRSYKVVCKSFKLSLVGHGDGDKIYIEGHEESDFIDFNENLITVTVDVATLQNIHGKNFIRDGQFTFTNCSLTNTTFDYEYLQAYNMQCKCNKFENKVIENGEITDM